MEKREFKIGDKVKIPKTKSKDLATSLKDCTAIENVKNLKQDYLYINGIREDEYYLGAELGRLDSAFGIQDLEHYEEEKIVLPECWFVLYNTKEQFDIINGFYNKGWTYCSYENRCGYHNNGDNQVYTTKWVGNSTTKEKLLKNGYIQITFEQFKKYVLKNNNMENNKQIIGYKLIKPEYKEAAENIVALGVNWKVGKSFIEVMENNPDDYYTKKLKEAGVLDLWFEPVYRKEKQTIQMYSSNKGMFEIEVVDGKAYYRPENKELPKEWIRDIINSYDDILIQQRNGVNPYSVIIAELHVGCYKNCRKEDWLKVYKLLK